MSRGEDKKKKDEEDMDFEIRFYEGILKEKEDFFQVLSALGDLYTRRGRYADGLAVDEKMARMRPGDSIVLYNLGYSYSLVGEIEKAHDTILSAIENGYDELDHLEADADLANLLKTKKFQKYLKDLKSELSSSKKKV